LAKKLLMYLDIFLVMGLERGRELFLAEFDGSGSMQTFEYLILSLVMP
jgi:hypothetical protein